MIFTAMNYKLKRDSNHRLNPVKVIQTHNIPNPPPIILTKMATVPCSLKRDSNHRLNPVKAIQTHNIPNPPPIIQTQWLLS